MPPERLSAGSVLESGATVMRVLAHWSRHGEVAGCQETLVDGGRREADAWNATCRGERRGNGRDARLQRGTQVNGDPGRRGVETAAGRSGDLDTMLLEEELTMEILGTSRGFLLFRL